ncbi:hypothetical protein J6590_002977 [Homalodisca vitripennis]|nr:hypothetical protein J6590_002977 [Homalodisca vitripennis]
MVLSNCLILYYYVQSVPEAEGVELDSYSGVTEVAPALDVVTEERLVYPGVRSSRSPQLWRDHSEIHLPSEGLREEGGIPHIRSLYKSGFLMNGSHICSDLGKGKRMLMAVISATGHFRARLAVRMTWGQLARRSNLVIAFFVGRDPDPEVMEMIHRENTVYKDVVQVETGDVYDNLTLKVLSMLEWADRFCPLVDYVFKVDDDIFVNIPLLLRVSDGNLGSNRTMYGNLNPKPKPFFPFHIPEQQSSVYKKEYPASKDPSFLSGGAYLLTNDLVNEIFQSAGHFRFHKGEDFFFTGVLARALNITRVHIKNFFKHDNTFICFENKYVTLHSVKPDVMFIVWKMFLGLRRKLFCD